MAKAPEQQCRHAPPGNVLLENVHCVALPLHANVAHHVAGTQTVTVGLDNKLQHFGLSGVGDARGTGGGREECDGKNEWDKKQGAKCGSGAGRGAQKHQRGE